MDRIVSAEDARSQTNHQRAQLIAVAHEEIKEELIKVMRAAILEGEYACVLRTPGNSIAYMMLSEVRDALRYKGYEINVEDTDVECSKTTLVTRIMW